MLLATGGTTQSACIEKGFWYKDVWKYKTVLWLLVLTLMKICHEKEQPEQIEIQNIQFGEKRNTGSETELSPAFKETKRLRSGMKGVVTSG